MIVQPSQKKETEPAPERCGRRTSVLSRLQPQGSQALPIESRNALCQSLTSTSDRGSLNSGPFLLGAVRAAIDRQIGWAKTQVRRQTRQTALVAALSGVAVPCRARRCHRWSDRCLYLACYATGYRSQHQLRPRVIIPMMTPTSTAPAIVPSGLRLAMPSSSDVKVSACCLADARHSRRQDVEDDLGNETSQQR